MWNTGCLLRDELDSRLVTSYIAFVLSASRSSFVGCHRLVVSVTVERNTHGTITNEMDSNPIDGVRNPEQILQKATPVFLDE
jgi:hypothetical protein